MRIFVSLMLCFILAGCGSMLKNNSIKDNQQFEHEENINYNQSIKTLTDEQKKEVLMFALNLLDIKYKFGGKNPEAGIDCSGFVTYVYKNAIGYNLKGSAADIAKFGYVVEKEKINDYQVGDLLFFNTTGKSFSHVGIYVGNNKFVHASSAKGNVKINSVFDSYYNKKLELVKRVG